MPPAKLSPERWANFAYQTGEAYSLAGIDSKGSLRKSIDSDNLCVTAVLTFPVKDLAGDFVHPRGCDFREHELKPDVDVEHSRTREFGNLSIAKCVHPDGSYAVTYRNLTLDDGAKHYLPVATSYFNKSSKPSMQVFRMISDDVLPGVSLEFKALSCRELGPSPLENRPAYEFEKISVVKYTHCAIPVNPGALTVTKSIDLLIPIVQSGRIGGEAVDPTLLGVLRKSVARYTPKRVLVSVGKAMDYEDPAPAPEATEPEPAGGPPTAAAAYGIAQAIKDAIEAGKQQLEASEHKAGKKKILARLEKLEAEVETLMGIGDQVSDDLDESGDDGDGMDEEPDEVEDDATDTDDDGVMKAFTNPKRLWVRKSILAAHIKRFSKADVEAAETADETIEQAMARIQRDDPAGWKQIERAKKQADRAAAWAE